jgi:hypothetical protein
MLLGVTAEANECEKPPFETPFDPLRVSLGKQGPATSFVVACASRWSRAPWATKDRPSTLTGAAAPIESQREILRLRGCAAAFVNARKLLMPMTFARRAANENARATSLRMTLCAHGGLVMTAK